MKRTFALAAAAGMAGLGVLSGCSPKKAESKTFTMTVVPYEAAQKLSEDYAPMATYLAKRVGSPSGEFKPVVDYTGVIAALDSGQIDVAYLSSFPYALASSRMKLQPLAMPVINGSLTYRGIIFVRADSSIKSLNDLNGKRVAFGDQASTSGYLLPYALLKQKNIVPSRSSNVGDANAVVAAVEGGTADAGCAYEDVFQVVYKTTPEKARLMRVVGATEAIPNGVWVAPPSASPEQVAKLRKAFMDMNTDPEGKAAMARAPTDKMVPADDSRFDAVREKARILNLDLKSLDKKR